MKESLIMTLLPFNVENCLAFPLTSRKFWTLSLFPDDVLGFGIRRTWLLRNSSEATASLAKAPLSASREVRSTSVSGTSRT